MNTHDQLRLTERNFTGTAELLLTCLGLHGEARAYKDGRLGLTDIVGKVGDGWQVARGTFTGTPVHHWKLNRVPWFTFASGAEARAHWQSLGFDETIHSDGDTVTLRHTDGRKIVIAHVGFLEYKATLN